MRLVFNLPLQAGRQRATAALDIQPGHGSKWLRFKLDTSSREVGGLWVYWNLARNGGLTAIADPMNAAIVNKKTFDGELYFAGLTVTIDGSWPIELVAPGRHWMGAGRQLPMAFNYGRNASFSINAEAGFGPTRVQGDSILEFIGTHYPGGLPRYRDDMVREQNQVLSAATYGPYQPYGQPRGNEAGGDELGFFHHHECVPCSETIQLALDGAIRIAHKTDTVMVDAETGQALLPTDLATDGYLAFDMHANTNDDGRIPHFNNVVGGPENVGECAYKDSLELIKQNDPEHMGRALLFLQGLVSYLPFNHPAAMWARATIYRRAAWLRMWKPEIPGKGSTFHEYATTPFVGFFDRDEGYMLHAFGLAHWASNWVGGDQSFDRHWRDNSARLNEIVTRATLNCALPNGMHQARSQSGNNWSTDGWSPDANGNKLKPGTLGAYSFQECIILGGITTMIRSGMVADDHDRAALARDIDNAAVFMFSMLVPSSSFEVNGEKMGVPDIIGVHHAHGTPEVIEEFHGAGHVVNTTMVAPDRTALFSLLGAQSTGEALRVMGQDTRAGYSGTIDWSLPWAVQLMRQDQGGGEGERPPVRPPKPSGPTDDPDVPTGPDVPGREEPDTDPDPDGDGELTDRDRLLNTKAQLQATIRSCQSSIAAINRGLRALSDA